MKKLTLLICIATAVLGCGPKIDLEKEKADLLAALESSRQAHFETDSEKLLSDMAVEVINIRDAQISTVTRADAEQRFQIYFKDAKFREWDYVSDPIIFISDDATLAARIEHIKVDKYDTTGVMPDVKFTYAGITLLKKENGRWIRVANATTIARPE
jgi:hypothetical protein